MAKQMYYWDGTQWIAVVAGDILPDQTGNGGKYLTTDGSASSWATVVSGGGATGGGTDKVFNENDQVVTTDYTLTAGKNASTAGPITINAGVTVTVPSGAAWVIL